MNIGAVIEVLKKEKGIRVAPGYYARIEEWRGWWAGQARGFHRYSELCANGRRREREMYGMRMAKKVCEDWACILLNEKTRVAVRDAASGAFLQGEDGQGGVLGEMNFWSEANALVEKAFYSGTGAFVLKIDGVEAQADGTVRKSPAARLRMEYLPAQCILPVSVKNGRITEAAFVSEETVRGERYLYVELHTKEAGGYVVENRYYREKRGELESAALPEGVAARVATGSEAPFFAIVKPNLVNPFAGGEGLGCAVFAQAIDNLKGVDLAFNNLCRDFRLGGKKVFYSREMTRMVGVDEQGKPIYIAPDDMMQQLFVSVGDEFTDDKKLVHEFNPDLRVEDNVKGVQAMLDYLSLKCGLGARHYRFDAGSAAVTATEYAGTRQELRMSAARHAIVVERALCEILRAVLWAGRHVLGSGADPETDIAVMFADGYIVSDEERRETDRADVRDGVMNRWEYRARWYGEDEGTAKRLTAEQSTQAAPGGA